MIRDAVPGAQPLHERGSTVIEKLAYALGRNDEEPNIILALELVKTGDKKGIKEIVAGLHDPVEGIANDCIKVLYEIAAREPVLVSAHVHVMIDLLRSRNNRLVWGGMTALAKIAPLTPKEIFAHIDTVISAYKKGSVITVDNSISVFAELVKAGPAYEKTVFPVIIAHLETCRPREVGQHAEKAFVCVHRGNAGVFKKALLKRRNHLADSQKRRVDKLLKNIEQERFHA